MCFQQHFTLCLKHFFLLEAAADAERIRHLIIALDLLQSNQCCQTFVLLSSFLLNDTPVIIMAVQPFRQLFPDFRLQTAGFGFG